MVFVKAYFSAWMMKLFHGIENANVWHFMYWLMQTVKRVNQGMGKYSIAARKN